MKIEHKRIANVKNGQRAYCISHVYIDGVYSHDTIEDYDRGLNQTMSETEAKRLKVQDKTAIPTGTYEVKMNIVSGTFVKKAYYKAFCGGRLPRLDPVVGFSGILIHRGVDENSSSGCIIVGRNKVKGKVIDSQSVFESLYRKMKMAWDRGEKIEYKITRTFAIG